MQQPVEDLVPNGAGGYVRRSLMQAVAANKGGTPVANPPSNDPEEIAEGVSTDNEAGEQGQLPAGITPAHIDAAQKAAAQGDQESIDWLKGLGIAVGTAAVAGGAYATMKAMGNRKKPMPTVAASTMPNKIGTSVARHQPEVTQLRDEQIISNGPRSQPSYQGVNGQQPQGRLTQAQGVLPSPQDMQQLMQPTPNYAVGPTQRQMETDAAYAQHELHNSKPKVQLKKAVAANKAARMAEAAAAFRRIR